MEREDPKPQQPRFGQYVRAVKRLDDLARERFGRRVIHLAIGWILDQPGVGIALWGTRRPEQLDAVPEACGFRIDDDAGTTIDRILEEEITDPVDPEFNSPISSQPQSG